MPSSFTWLDASEADRRRALEVIDLFSKHDTRDQLGLAGIRDAWADHLAPGTSTIQTRARYFLFVPWMYQALAAKGVRADQVAKRARRGELDLIEAIQATDLAAVPIGAQVGRGLKRLPSDIYWGGLGRWGVRLFKGSRARYHRAFGREPPESAAPGEGSLGADWNPHIPAAPEDFPERATLDLRADEAEFLRDQILQHARGSWIAHLVGLDELWDDVPAQWEHPAVASAPASLAEEIEHARLFSLAMHGAALLYSLMLAQQLEDEGSLSDWEARFEDWAERVLTSADALVSWNLDEFWSRTLLMNPRIPGPSRRFARAWIDGVRARIATGQVAGLATDEPTRQSIVRRESVLKQHRARLTHREHLLRWSGASGAGALDYRWPITQRLVRDIQLGLGNG